MQRRKVLRSRIVRFLKGEPDGLSQLALMCLCHGYRYTHKKILFFSVVEQKYLQARQFEDAELLLAKMLSEADAYYDTYKVKLEVKEARDRRQLEAIKAYDLVKPPKEVITRPAERRLVSGNPALSEFGSMRMFGGISDVLKEQMMMQGLLPDSLQPPQYETIPEESEPSPYALLEAELEHKLENYPKVVWQKLESERGFAVDDKVTRQISVARQATRRALLALLEEGEVTVEDKRVNAIFRLASEPS